jgi:hypothetical protein
MKRIPQMKTIECPGPTLKSEALAYNFGRAEQMPAHAAMRIGFAIKSLEKCAEKELTAHKELMGDPGQTGKS